MESGIYMIVNKTTGNRYVGQTNNFHRRFIQHKTRTRWARSVIGRAFRKHGKEAFEFIIIERCSVEELDAREIHHIATIRPEYNMNKGGDGNRGFLQDAKTRAHLSVTSRAAWDRLDKDTQRAIVDKIQANRKPQSAEERTKKSVSIRAYWKTHKRPAASDLQRRRAREVNRIIKIDNKHGIRKPVVQMNVLGEHLAYFETAVDAAHAVGIHPSGITHMLKGDQKKAAGYSWKYYDSKETA